MKLTGKQLNEWRAFVSHHAIVDSRLLFEHSDVEIISAANGIGPAFFPEAVRNVIDFLHPCFVLPSALHDISYTYHNDGTRGTFLHYNAVFVTNCKLMAGYTYSWYNPARYYVRHKASEFGTILDSFGWRAWMQAYEEAQNRLALG